MIVAALMIAVLVVVQPLGVFGHVVEDHFTEHSHPADDGSAVHGADAHPPEHDADHGHVWMTPAAVMVTLRLRQPQAGAAVGPLEPVPLPSAPHSPPFAPPRA